MKIYPNNFELTFLLISYDKRREPPTIRISRESHSLSPSSLSDGRELRSSASKNWRNGGKWHVCSCDQDATIIGVGAATVEDGISVAITSYRKETNGAIPETPPCKTEYPKRFRRPTWSHRIFISHKISWIWKQLSSSVCTKRYGRSFKGHYFQERRHTVSRNRWPGLKSRHAPLESAGASRESSLDSRQLKLAQAASTGSSRMENRFFLKKDFLISINVYFPCSW